MANNIALSITADVADLQVKRAIMSAELKAATKDLNVFAKEASTSGNTEALREGMLAAANAAEKAKAGIYTQFEVQRGLPVQMLLKHFKKDGDAWKIDDRLKGNIRFRPMNLLDDFRGLGRFDVIFCRNVLIYFDAQTKKQVLERMSSQVEGPGYLLLGAAETVLGVTDTFKPIAGQRGLYVQDPSKLAGRIAA